MTFIQPIKKTLKIMTACLFLTLMSKTAYADDAQIVNLLTQIKSDTDSILSIVNQLPAYLESLTEMAKSWNETHDNANVIGINQSSFGTLNTNFNTAYDTQKSTSKVLTNQYLSGNLSGTPGSPPSNANELSSSVLWGDFLVTPPANDPRSIDNYVQSYLANANGTNVIIPPPNASWGKANPAGTQYRNLYNMLAAIQSYDAYLIGRLAKQNDINAASKTLLTQASGSTWFSSIQTESLGLVLRHILMYDSQIYVDLERLIKLQQEQLAATAMTNALLSVNDGQTIGQLLVQQASSQPAGT